MPLPATVAAPPAILRPLLRTRPMLVTFALTLFVSALLLFMVQPLIGKLIVPKLGGFPSVWNTCMFFFQAMLLCGYAYAHYMTNWLGVRRQAIIHLVLIAVVAVPVLAFRLEVFDSLVPAGEGNPIPGLLLLLLVSAGLPFFVISTTAPLLQRWFASTNHPDARDPYFLYAASNVGSMVALAIYPAASVLAIAGYPQLVQTLLDLSTQRWVWAIAYVVLGALIAVCAWVLYTSPPASAGKSSPYEKAPGKTLDSASQEGISTYGRFQQFTKELAGTSLAAKIRPREQEPLTFARGLRWVALAFVPSSLMLGVTTYITTDIASIAQFWVLTLVVYLLSFIIVFSKQPPWVHKAIVLATPVLLLLLVFLVMAGPSGLKPPIPIVIVLHTIVLFFVALVCHGELARDRPPARDLTRFFLLMSLGGVLGGLFNALIAPVVFKSLAEYPIAMVLAALLIPRLDEASAPSRRTQLLDFVLPLGIGVLCLELFLNFPATRGFLGLIGQEGVPDRVRGWTDSLADALGQKGSYIRLILIYGPPVVLSYVFVERPLRFGLAVAAILFVSILPNLLENRNEIIFRDRSFFGIVNVKSGFEYYPTGTGDDVVMHQVTSHRLMHGNILHGTQYMSDEFRSQPLTYYHHSGPIGQLMAMRQSEAGEPFDLAVIGLGTGTMSAYPHEGQSITFYEIDPLVKHISYDQAQYFTYVQDARDRGVNVNIVLGDARLTMNRRATSHPDEKYDVIVVDAFSSDAIPVHLITQEAMDVYLAKLKPDGIIAFHTSNRYLRLEPVVGNIAAKKNLAALTQHDGSEEGHPGKSASSWVIVTRDEENFGKLLDDVKVDEEDRKHHWQHQPREEKLGEWTDSFENLWSVFNWSSK